MIADCRNPSLSTRLLVTLPQPPLEKTRSPVGAPASESPKDGMEVSAARVLYEFHLSEARPLVAFLFRRLTKASGKTSLHHLRRISWVTELPSLRSSSRCASRLPALASTRYVP